MKATAAMLVLLAGMTATSSAALADEASSVKKDNTAAFPGGGWDANNLRVSVTRSKLLAPVGASACTTITAAVKSN